jgi:ornithine cyclodeaminase/alanine dehydrogenase
VEEAALVYLSANDVSRCMPALAEQLDLVRQAFQALRSEDAELPPKVGVHPRPQALIEAMPAWLQGRDLVGMKWISAYPANRSMGRDHVQGLLVLNDAQDGAPQCVMDARPVTAARTAAVSVFSVANLMAHSSDLSVAVFGAGVQGRTHVAALAGAGLVADLRVFDRNSTRASDLAAWAKSDLGVPMSQAFRSTTHALAGANLLITCASPGAQRQILEHRSVAGLDLIVAIDDDVYVSAEIVDRPKLFLVDDVAHFRAFRSSGSFAGFRHPDGSLADDLSRLVPTDRKPVVVVALGIGLMDLIFATAVFENARSRQIGIELPR